ncbi:uncharacterized protein TNCV_2177751 [Trichonephila clavipes]|uniref:Retrotransposon gag domain-containing protein n=1 Tax=Trichonephila clavipes TaxID=2585209 RepID=A0A8X6VU46_TRICX|nr:uncharacterized protein TNCV_2177751 [Trichonephila clavipes]
MRDSTVTTTSFHYATHILLSLHHWRRRCLWFCVKDRPSNGRLPDRPLCCKRRRMIVTEFLEGIDNKIKLIEIPSDLSSVYLKGHLIGRALDWFQIFGSELVQNTAMDFAQLKAALSKAFSTIQNRKDLETRFYASQQRQNQNSQWYAKFIKNYADLCEPLYNLKRKLKYLFGRLRRRKHSTRSKQP